MELMLSSTVFLKETAPFTLRNARVNSWPGLKISCRSGLVAARQSAEHIIIKPEAETKDLARITSECTP